MSLVLRHKPEEIDIELDENGWVSVDLLIVKMNARGFKISQDTINEVVATNDKKRFAFNSGKTMIRASQGHSVNVNLHLQEVVPPDVLFHGTAEKFLNAILTEGLQKQRRQHVHLSAAIETARLVGTRHGKPVVLNIHARAMQEAGYLFYLSENNVWLTDSVPVQFITQ